MSRALAKSWLRSVILSLLPATAFAQSAITGVVKDATGAVLVGVSVEAASDALIERVRAAVTDSQGVYRIVDLRPGTYAVTFSLQGFRGFKREDLELPSEFTATVNAELGLGPLEDVVTVTAGSPMVDTTTAVHTRVLDREAIDQIPTGRTIQGMAQLIVGINLNLPDTGGARAMQQTYMSTHGMSIANNTVMVDGMLVNGLQLDGGVQSYFNDAMNQEVSYQTSGIGADTAAGGVRLNMIPREGGNRFSGDFKASARPGEWQSDNLTARHRARGLTVGNATDRIVDYTAAMGGPLLKDRLWFFASARYFSVNNFVANTFMDDGSQGIDDQYIKSAMARLTWQLTPRNKVSAYFDEIDKYRGHDMQSNEDPETASLRWFSPAYNTGALKWTSTASSRMLIEAGYSRNLEYYTNSYQEGVEKTRFSPEWFASASRLENDLGGRKTAATSQTTQSPERHNIQAAVSYVTGAHSFKAGFQYTWGDFWHTVDANGDLTQQYPQQRHRRALLGTRQRDHPQHAAPLRRAAEPRSRPVRAGLVAARPADAQRRHPLGEPEGAGAGQRVGGGPVRTGAQHGRHHEPAGLEGLGAAVRRRLRPLRHRQDRRQVPRSTATTRSAPLASPPTTTRSSRPRRLPCRGAT